jgi:hypothetical protein
MNVIVTAPHVCLIPKRIDRSCDYGTDKFAEEVLDAVKNSGVKYLNARLFVTDIARRSCDTNRKICSTVSDMRIALTEHMEKLKRKGRPFLLFDVHSFGRNVGAFGYAPGTEPYIVLLALYKYDKALAEILLRQLKNHGVSAALLGGSLDNDIIYEAAQNGGQGVLIEFPEDADINSDPFSNTMKAIKETVQEFNYLHPLRII